MKNIGLIIDEGADLPREIAEEHQIKVVPFKIDFGEMKDLPGNIYQKIGEAEKRGLKSFVKTSQPPVGDFISIFKEKLKEFEEIICLTITSKHSGTFNSACQAKNFLTEDLQKRISIIDSLNISAGEGLLALEAVSLIEKGLAKEEILEELKESIPKIRLICLIEDPKWLEASGRVSHFIASWIRQMQKIGVRPLLGIKKGEIKPIGIKKGARDIASALFQEFQSKVSKSRNQITKVAITQADSPREGQRLKEMVERTGSTEILFINIIGTVLGGYAGPGAVALAWQE